MIVTECFALKNLRLTPERVEGRPTPKSNKTRTSFMAFPMLDLSLLQIEYKNCMFGLLSLQLFNENRGYPRGVLLSFRLMLKLKSLPIFCC